MLGSDRPAGPSVTDRRASLRKLALLSQFPFVVLVVTGLGFWADSRWGTMPWLTLGAFFAGLTAASIHLFTSLK